MLMYPQVQLYLCSTVLPGEVVQFISDCRLHNQSLTILQADSLTWFSIPLFGKEKTNKYNKSIIRFLTSDVQFKQNNKISCSSQGNREEEKDGDNRRQFNAT